MLLNILIVIVPFALVVYLCQQYIRFRSIPGPFLAKFTDLWRLRSVYNRDAHDVQARLHFPSHKQCNDIVRLGPNTLSVTGPNYIPQIYGIDKKLRKSDYYAVFQNIVNGRRAASLVAMTDEAEHARTRRQVAHAFSLSSLVEFEVLVDSTTEVFLAELSKRFGDGKVECDLGRWLQYYAFDVIGELTFSKRLGFIETGEDVSSIIHSIGRNFDYFSVLGQMPWLDETFLGKNPLYVKYFRRSVSSPILQFAQKLLSERLTELENGTGQEKERLVDKPDFLSRFLAIREKAKAGEKEEEEGEPMSDGQLLAFLFANINAGSDTIASTLRALFYYLLKNPSSLNRLLKELDTSYKSGNLTLPCPSWTETQSEQSQYLRAVVKEAIRLNPALSLPLERTVGPQGLTLSSEQSELHLSSGTVVGINPYVLHRDPRIFDPKGTYPVNYWNPDRWMADGGLSPEQIKTMDQSILSFGAGKRSCLGRNIAMMELQKLVPALLMRFDVRLVKGADAQWEVRNSWVLSQKGLDVYLKEKSILE